MRHAICFGLQKHFAAATGQAEAIPKNPSSAPPNGLVPGDHVLIPEQRILRAKIAANTRWAGETGKANAQRTQAGLKARFIREARQQFPDLSGAEIERRGESAYRAHMQRLALKSSKARAQGGDLAS